MRLICLARQKGKTHELLERLASIPNSTLVVASSSLRDGILERIENSEELRGKIKPCRIRVASPYCLRSVGGPVLVDDADVILEILMCGGIGMIDTISITG